MEYCPICKTELSYPIPKYCPRCRYETGKDLTINGFWDIPSNNMEEYQERLENHKVMWTERLAIETKLKEKLTKANEQMLKMMKEMQEKIYELESKIKTTEGKLQVPKEKIEETPSTNKTILPEMIYVEGGTFMMGFSELDDEDETYRMDDELYDYEPRHSVTLKSFYIGKYQITQKEWLEIMGTNPSRFANDPSRPVEKVSWNMVQEFIAKLNQLTGKKYRLPTEAEWEYAALGGNQSKDYDYAGSNYIGYVAWNFNNSGKTTHPVGTKLPNELGIYDMSGNVFEWCNDWYCENYYSNSPSDNPQGPESGKSRVLRGGSYSDSCNCFSLSRYYASPDYNYSYFGVRLAIDA